MDSYAVKDFGFHFVNHDKPSIFHLIRWAIIGFTTFSLYAAAGAENAHAQERLEPCSILWRAKIGSSNGTPVLHRGKILIGTNNSFPRDPDLTDDRGVVMCFNQKDGVFLGQITHSRLHHRSNDMPGLGIISHPCVEDNRAYYVSNRGELVCINIDAFSEKENDPIQQKVIWKLDMVEKLGVFKRDAGDIGNPLSSPIIIGDLVYCITGNGSAFGYAASALPRDTPFVPKPDAPSFIAVDKKTGKLIWSSAAPGKRIQYGQWASPGYAKVSKMDLVLFPGGDGWLYGFEARTGRMIWKVDCNDKTASSWGPGKPGTRTSFLATPIVSGRFAYIPASLDLEMTHVRRPLYAIELDNHGDATKTTIRWTFYDRRFRGSFGSVALGKNSLYVLGDTGLFVCLDPITGNEHWRVNLAENAKRFSSPCVANGMVLACAGSKLFFFEDSRNQHLLRTIDLQSEIMGTPVMTNKHVYVATDDHLYSLLISEKDEKEKLSRSEKK